ncbi:hypothetical protein LCGC14_0351940 [marine sediment metagenome]|uniref:Uncharacterized protein n=1 Tax=marine sediment metagenome TaxID=412755 RepID=A0A0F9TAU9_9ZZZZ
MNEIILNKKEGNRVVRERHYKAGYTIRDEYWLSHFKDKPEGHALLTKKGAYNLYGHYIGDSKWAYKLIVKHGISPIKKDVSSYVCSIGFCAKEEKWYGWSHRAIQGFGYNDMLFEENWYPEGGTGERDKCGFLIECEKVPFRLRGSIKITGLNQAKQAAINFAEYIS